MAFHVPGRYSGGSTEAYSWTQTLNEIELRAPLPAGLPEKSVRCKFAAKRLDLTWEGGEQAAVIGAASAACGDLPAVIVASDCLWVIEREGAADAATAVVTMRKAVPEVWDRLFAHEAAPAEPPALLDGLQREEPQSKQELLKQAKERLAKELDGPSRAKPFALEGLENEQRVLSKGDLPELPVVTLRNCKGCTILLPADLSLIKLQVEQCSACEVRVLSRLLTETVEVWECDGCRVRLGSKAMTVQVDKCNDLKLTYSSAAFFDRIMSTGARALEVAFDDAAELATRIDLDALQAERPDMTLDENIDQFITRRVKGEPGLSTELVIRLCNEFPTTEREVREFEARTRVHEEKLDEVVDSMLGSSLGKNLTAAEREQMKTMMREQSAAASAAQRQAEQTVEGRAAARVDFKKNEGNTAFKAGNYQQAAVFYTEALSLDASLHALYSNRAACFLKLGRYAQAREDATECVRLAPDFAKGHFRLALALQAEEKPGEACAAFNKVLALEPNNKDAAAGLNMARMQAERQRRQQAGDVRD